MGWEMERYRKLGDLFFSISMVNSGGLKSYGVVWCCQSTNKLVRRRSGTRILYLRVAKVKDTGF